MKLKTGLINFKQEFDLQLNEFFDQRLVAARKIDSTLVDITTLLQAQILRGGKRFRPFLCIQAYELAGGKNRKAILKAAMGVELMHQFLLIHDDIVDRDERRYGDDTLHVLFEKQLSKEFGGDTSHLSNSFAMGAGDHLYGLALQALYASSFDPELIVKAADWMTDYLGTTVAGWVQQFYLLKRSITQADEADYIRSAYLVSGHYTIFAPLRMGLILADTMKLEKPLADYGRAVGHAFQIKDDLLGMFGDPKVTGKPVGNDFREGKKTSLILTAYERAEKKDKLFLLERIGTALSEDELKKVQSIIRKTGAYDEAVRMANDYIAAGKKALGDIPNESRQRTLLLELADYIVSREK